MNRYADLARSILQSRRVRMKEFGYDLFTDVAWDMLLILFIADADGRRLTGRELIEACEADFEVGRRWMAYLNNVDLVTGDGNGHVEDLLTMSLVGLTKMERFLHKTDNIMANL